MTAVPLTEAEAVLDRALECLVSGVSAPLTGPATAKWSERCVEVPWAASHLRDARDVLDVGWAMSPPEWLGVLLATVDRGAALTGVDIIDPHRVRSRYPKDIVERVIAIPVRIESILDADSGGNSFDTVTCISTLEHIGFDMASPPEDTTSAFVRAKSPQEAVASRDPDTDRLFLDSVARFLRPGGALLLSVPAGHGVPILHQDSLGLFTHQFEYDEAGWESIIHDPRFTVTDEAFFRHTQDAGWTQVPHFSNLTDQTSALKPFATGCAAVRMVLN